MTTKPNPSSSLIYLPVLFSVLAMILVFMGIAFDWMGVSGVAALEYCEAPRNQLVRQPANSWSNLGFIFVGWIIAFRYKLDQSMDARPLFNRTAFYPVFYSFLAVFLGIGSFAYHASTTHLGGILDAGSMYLLSSFMLAYALKRLLSLSPIFFSLLFFAGLIVSFYMNFQPGKYPGAIDAGSMIFGLLLIIASLVELFLIYGRRIDINGKWAFAFIATFILSVFIWSRSRTGGIWCDPGSLLQGHAIWHLLDALCVYFIYRYYRSEE